MRAGPQAEARSPPCSGRHPSIMSIPPSPPTPSRSAQRYLCGALFLAALAGCTPITDLFDSGGGGSKKLKPVSAKNAAIPNGKILVNDRLMAYLASETTSRMFARIR